jgi:rare lipoprotein A
MRKVAQHDHISAPIRSNFGIALPVAVSGEKGVSGICTRSLSVTIGARRSLAGGRKRARRTFFQLSAVALTAALLSACTQTAAGDKSLLAALQQPSPTVETSRKKTSTARHRQAKPARVASLTTSDGMASFYRHGSRTASGEKFNPRELTAAHPSLPFGTRVRVTNVSTGRSVTVRINDRGPFVRGRVIDVSHSAAESLGMVGRGVAKVKLDVVE